MQQLRIEYVMHLPAVPCGARKALDDCELLIATGSGVPPWLQRIVQ